MTPIAIIKPALVSPKNVAFAPELFSKIQANTRGCQMITLRGQPYAAVPRTTLNSQRLADAGFTAPIALQDYPFPRPPWIKSPYAHQVETMDFMVRHRNMCCYNDTGTGKTLSTLWALDYLRSQKLCGKVIIATTLSTVTSVWQSALFEALPRARVAVLTGDKKKRRKLLQDPSIEYYVTNHDGLKTMTTELVQLKGVTHFVVDEANVIANHKSEMFKAAQAVAKGKSVWLLTATPCSQSPLQAWAMGLLVCPQRLPASYPKFRVMVCEPKMIHLGPINKTQWLPKADAMETVFSMLQPAIRFSKEDCLTLPPVTYSQREIPLTAEQTRMLKALRTDYMTRDANGVLVAADNGSSRWIKALQIYTGTVINETGAASRIDCAPRLQALLDIINESSAKVVVFVPFLGSIAQVTEFLTKHKISNRVITGNVTASARRTIIHDFEKATDPRVLVAHPKTTSHGITLVAADTTVWFAPYPSTESVIQANGRVDRPGQTRSMRIIELHSGHLEKKVYELVRTNRASQNNLMTLYKEMD